MLNITCPQIVRFFVSSLAELSIFGKYYVRLYHQEYPCKCFATIFHFPKNRVAGAIKGQEGQCEHEVQSVENTWPRPFDEISMISKF
jgi:hypothetical protein